MEGLSTSDPHSCQEPHLIEQSELNDLVHKAASRSFRIKAAAMESAGCMYEDFCIRTQKSEIVSVSWSAGFA
jgi:hypothetical protein